MCQRVDNTVNTVLYCNYRCVVDIVTSRGKKNNANIPKLHITKLLIDINQQDLTPTPHLTPHLSTSQVCDGAALAEVDVEERERGEEDHSSEAEVYQEDVAGCPQCSVSN